MQPDHDRTLRTRDRGRGPDVQEETALVLRLDASGADLRKSWRDHSPRIVGLERARTVLGCVSNARPFDEGAWRLKTQLTRRRPRVGDAFERCNAVALDTFERPGCGLATNGARCAHSCASRSRPRVIASMCACTPESFWFIVTRAMCVTPDSLSR